MRPPRPDVHDTENEVAESIRHLDAIEAAIAAAAERSLASEVALVVHVPKRRPVHHPHAA